MGIFQIALLIELFFVLGTIQKAAVQKTGEPEQVSCLGITLTYLSASLASLVALVWMIYEIASFDFSNEESMERNYMIDLYLFLSLAILLTGGVIILVFRLWMLKRVNVDTKDGPKTLRNFYVVFMFSYIERVIANYYFEKLENKKFLRELFYDWSAVIWDALPITCLLVVHY